MAAKKNDTSTASTPFSTSSGNVPGQPSYQGARGQDFTRSPTSDAQRAQATPGRNFVRDATSQAQMSPPDDEAIRMDRTQVPGTPEQRVDAASIVRGGLYPQSAPSAAAQSRGADPGPQPARSPFKNMR